MKRIKYNEMATTNNPHGVDARKLHANDDVQVVHILLKPGESLKKHSFYYTFKQREELKV